ncbi:MAG: hypothetical protein AMXMBFR84_33120 [Candidatus Hydrogenedentota bacterium]
MPTKLGRVAPTFYIRDHSRALTFWAGPLGFQIAYTNREPAVFAVVRRDAAEVHLAVNPQRAGQGHCHIMVEDLAN